MKRNKQLLLILLLCTFTVLTFGCSKTEVTGQVSAAVTTPEAKPTATPEVKPVSLTISAAASLKDAMEEIKQLYSKEKANVTITYNFGASGSLQQQIEQGAPVDIFMSAATKQMDALKQKSLLLDDTILNLLENKVVLVTQKDAARIKDFKDMGEETVRKIALGEPKSVPVGQYSEEIINFLGIKDKVQPKAVYAKDVREVLTWVETGNVDAGIVYETDAKISDQVKVVAYAPEKSHTPVIYPVAVLKDSRNAEASKEFLTYLTGNTAKAVFEKFGFSRAK